MAGEVDAAMPAWRDAGGSAAGEEVGAVPGRGVGHRGVQCAGFEYSGGTEEEIVELEQRLQEHGVSYQRLRTSHGFHCALVEPAMEPFLEVVQKVRLQAPKIPFLSNVTGRWIREEEAQDPKYWVQQMRSPVQFSAGVQELLREPGRVLLEVGPGQTLRRLALRQPEARRGRLFLASLPAAPTRPVLQGRVCLRRWEGYGKRV